MNDPWIDTALVRKLIAGQFPQWAHLDPRPVAQSGWDNRTFHLGNAMSVRLPSAARYAAQAEKEQRWLPHLAQHLPLSIPSPVGRGLPADGYPFHWTIMAWLEGETLATQPIEIQQSVAADLAAFLNALRQAPTQGAPKAGQHNFYRGGDLRIYDQEIRHYLPQLGDTVDSTAILKIWTRACQSAWNGKPVWVHGDVAAGNLLCRDRGLSAVIDFGGCGIGDPACDLVPAWTIFRQDARAVFRDCIGLDRDTWDRAAGWCLWKAVLMACKYEAGGMETITAVLESHIVP